MFILLPIVLMKKERL